jgi:hypothetical protein
MAWGTNARLTMTWMYSAACDNGHVTPEPRSVGTIEKALRMADPIQSGSINTDRPPTRRSNQAKPVADAKDWRTP